MDTQQLLLDYIAKDIAKSGRAIQADEDLLATGVLDSLGILQLVAFIDDRLGIQVPDEDVVYENFHSVNALSDYLATLQ